MSDRNLPRTIKEIINQDKEASNVERLHIFAMAEIAGHLWWVALGVKLGLIMMVISIFIMLVSLGSI